MADLYRDAAGVRLPMAGLPAEVTSVTYANSSTAKGQGVPLGLPAPAPEHAGRVYRLDELEDLIACYGLANDTAPRNPGGYAGHQHQCVDAYIEVQLWSDEPITTCLTTS